jgi:acetyltransferase
VTGIREAGPITTTLRDGRRVSIRTVHPGDAEAFRDAFARLSPEARYNRMMGSVRALSDALVDKAVNPVEGKELALVAVPAESTTGEIVGGARYISDARGESCEFAVATADAWRRSGLATALMKALISSARARGLRRMEGYVLASNRAMLDFARRFGFEITPSSEDPTVRLVRLNLISR